MGSKRARACLLSCLLVARAPAVFAVDSATRSAARDLGYEGVEAYEAGNYPVAMDRLERAYAVLKVPSLALWSARALEKNGKLVEASERYLEATRLTADAAWGKDVQKQAQEQAAEERAALLPRLAKLTVVIRGADPEAVVVTVNGAAVARALYEVGLPLNPGEALVTAVEGDQRVEAKVRVAEGGRPSVTLDFTPQVASVAPEAAAASSAGAPAEQERGRGSWQRTAGWIGIGVGGGALVFGAVTGILAIGKNSDLAAACDSQGNCPNGQADALAEYDALRAMSSTGLIAGAALAAIGCTLLVVAPKRESARFVSPYVGWATVGVRGAF